MWPCYIFSSLTVHAKLLCNLYICEVGVLCTCEVAVTLHLLGCLVLTKVSFVLSAHAHQVIYAAEPLYLAMPVVFARVIEFM